MYKTICSILVLAVISFIFKTFIVLSLHTNYVYKVDNEVDTVLVGDSHAMYGLSDKKIPNSLNISNRAEKYIWSYRKLQNYLQKNSHIKKVVLSVSHHSFTKGNDVEIFGEDCSFFNSRYGSLYKTEDYVNLFNEKYFNKDLFQSFLKYKLGVPIEGHKEIRNVITEKIFSRNKKPAFLGEYYEEIENDLSEKRLLSTTEKHYSELGVSSIQKLYFDKIIKLVLDKGLSLTLVTLPVHADYLSKVPLEQKIILSSIVLSAMNRGARYINLSTIKINELYFKDYDHLNHKGALFIAQSYLRRI